MADEVIQEFLAESWENLAQLDTSIVSLEKEPSNAELLAGIFRTIHTIKGTCGFLGLGGLGRLAHAAENVLGKMRDGTLDVNSSAISIVLEGVDRIKDLLQGLEATGEEPQVDSTKLIHKLDLLASLGEPMAGRAPTPKTPEIVVAAPPPPPLEPVPVAVAEPMPVPASPAPAPAAFAADDHEASAVDAKKCVADLSIRVNVDVLDRLMNLVGELVLTRNQLLQMVRGEDESKYAGPISHLNRVTTDLQEGVMKTRMQPIGNAWSKLPRLVRDLNRITGKQIELEMQGAETELDRTVLDAIKDPLTHMVRNSADHGIETPAVRRSLGKPEAGRLKLNAFHEGGHVIICIEDDGAGINRQRVVKKALEQGLITEAEASQLPDSEIVRLIMRPGFSTAEQVTSISGRGVGMDVVRTEIERIGGTVELTSIQGQGTKVRIKIPLTLAIISALVVESGGQCFAIPQLGVVELVRLSAEDRRRVERVHKHEVFRLRDRLLPLIHLHSVLQLEGHQLTEHDDINIVVVQVGEEQFGLMVDVVFDTQEIVVKPVGSLLKTIKVYQGTTILGDGRVIMILDVAGVAAQFGGISAKTQELEQPRDGEDDVEATSLLLFDTAQGDRMAVPLALVSRLEEIPTRTLERSGERLVVQYRGQLLPLVPISGKEGSDSSRETQPVVVFSDGQQSLGIMVDRIQDIIEEPLIIRMPSPRPGVLGTAIISGQATDVLDTQHYLLQVNPEWFRRTSTLKAAKKVLVIDDSMFFRQLVRTALESEGYRATVVDSAERAIELLDQKNEKFDVILCDIEMPGMDGCQFAEWCRKQPGLLDLPLVAITSLDAEVHGARIMGAGFDRLLVKFHPRQLRDTLTEITKRQDRLVTGISA